MEKLFFALQNDKQFKRHIHILKYLSAINTPVNSAELAREVECTKPTLRADIAVLNKALPPEVQIEENARGLFQIMYPTGTSIDSYITEMARNSTVFQIIDNIFHNRIYSFRNAMDELYLSKTVLRQKLHHINDILKRFNLSISTIQLEFIGAEVNIRYFLFVFYCDFRDCFIVHTANDVHAKSYADLLILGRDVNLPRLHFNYFRTTIWISVIKERLLHKHHVSIAPELIDEVSKKESFVSFTHIFHKSLNNIFGFQNLPLQEAIFGYLISLHCISYSDACSLEEEDVPYVYCREESVEVIEQINTILRKGLPKECLEDGSLKPIQAFLINLRLLTKLTPLFQCVSLPVQAYVKDSSQDLFQKWYQIIQEQDSLFIPHLSDVAVTLSMLHLDMINQIKPRKIRVLFAFQGEAGYDNTLVYTTKLLLSNMIDAVYSFEKSITREIIEKTQANLVVCNYDLPMIPCACNIIRLSYIPNSAEWASLKNIVLNLTC